MILDVVVINKETNCAMMETYQSVLILQRFQVNSTQMNYIREAKVFFCFVVTISLGGDFVTSWSFGADPLVIADSPSVLSSLDFRMFS